MGVNGLPSFLNTSTQLCLQSIKQAATDRDGSPGKGVNRRLREQPV